MRPATVLALALLPLPLPAVVGGGEPQAIQIERKVQADVLVGPSVLSIPGAGGPACPRGIAKPRTGDTVTLTVADRMARRDQPGLSLIVRLDDRRAYLLFHPDRTFARLGYPVEKPEASPPPGWDRKTWRRHQQQAAVPKELQTRLLHPLATERRAIGALQAVVSRGVLGNDVRPHLDVEVVHEAGARPFAEAGNALEESFQELRPGTPWIGLLGPPSGLLLGWAEAAYLPDAKVHYREEFAALRDVPLRAELFEPPADYQRVELDGVCLLGFSHSREN